MKKMALFSVIFLISSFVTCIAGAEVYNEDAYFKDHVTLKDESNVVLAVNRDTEEIELYWSDKDQTWLRPDEKYLAELKKLYREKTQLRWMQKRLDQMRNETLFTKDQGGQRNR